MNNDVMFSSKTCEWATPQDLFDKLNSEFCLTLARMTATTNVRNITRWSRMG